MDELIERMEFAIKSLEGMLVEGGSIRPIPFQKMDRLNGKIEGMKLALSYVREEKNNVY